MRRAAGILAVGLLVGGCVVDDEPYYRGEGLGSDIAVTHEYYYEPARCEFIDGPYYRSGYYYRSYPGGPLIYRPYGYDGYHRYYRHYDNDHRDIVRDREPDRVRDRRDNVRPPIHSGDRNTDTRVRDRDQQRNSQDSARPRDTGGDRGDRYRSGGESDRSSNVRPGPRGEPAKPSPSRSGGNRNPRGN